MNTNNFNKQINIKGKTFLFHHSVQDETLTEIRNRLNNKKGKLSLFNQIYGRITSDTEKKRRKVLNAVIKARNDPINAGRDEIVVRLNSKKITIKPLLYKD